VSDTNRAVFLDRDGTLIEDADYLTRIEDIRILPGVPEALRDLKAAGYLLLVVTNQSAIARGWLTEEKLHAINEHLNGQFAERGAAVDAFYHCPHLPGGTVAEYACECECRKPNPGLLRQAAADWHVDARASYMVGDSERDVEAGACVGCYGILVGGGTSARADACVADLREAASLILARGMG